MKILLSGATGLIGRRLASRLFQEGHDLVALTRDPRRAAGKFGFPVEFATWENVRETVTRVDAVVHLAGESIAGGRWTAARKAAILESRVEGTRMLARAIQDAGAAGPRAFVTASAVGFYGDRGDELLDESSTKGEGFLSDVCEAWENEARAVLSVPNPPRLAIARIGVVLSAQGGALEKMLPVFRAGLGGKLGSGKQWMSWIHIEDLVALLERLVLTDGLSGVFNATSPEPATNAAFTRELGQAIGVPTVMPVPGLALRAAVGEMSDALLGGARALPKRALESGFEFRYPRLESAFDELASHGWKGRLTEFTQEQWIPRPLPEVFEFFSDARNLDAITPEMLRFKTLRISTPEIGQGTLIDHRLKIRGMPVRWRSRITEWKPVELFVDEQVKGPYKIWKHRHAFRALRGGTWMTDRVQYVLPMGAIGRAVAGRVVARDVARIFAHRRKVIAEKLG